MSLFYCNVCHSTYAWPGCTSHPGESIIWNGALSSSQPLASDTSALKLAETKARRERIATAILGGFLSNDKWKFEPDQTAKAALIFADALIEELDKEEK